ncbi:MAG: HAMP domain-containing histidine kinase, partial [Anaerolineae bacterium]|nr:HAMP domain-containing histidine kinase [Anaerolineae bacterium]
FIGDLTSIFAHEVRNPINNIYTGLQLMERRLDEDDPNHQVIKKMQDDFNRLNHLMDSLLSYSRPMHRSDEVDINALIRKILIRWRPRMIKQKISPFFQSDGKPAIIEGDQRALEQVFINLISNALDAMSSNGGTLAIHINNLQGAPARPQIEVSITDNGPGIPDEFKDRIFEPFITNKPRGTGLGLAITKQIVTAHKGTVSVSTFPGGTVFHVYLPAITEKMHEWDNTDR